MPKVTLSHKVGDQVFTRKTARCYSHVCLYRNPGDFYWRGASWHGSEALAVKGCDPRLGWEYQVQAINGGAL